jgi:hypothetical protein
MMEKKTAEKDLTSGFCQNQMGGAGFRGLSLPNLGFSSPCHLAWQISGQNPCPLVEVCEFSDLAVRPQRKWPNWRASIRQVAKEGRNLPTLSVKL